MKTIICPFNRFAVELPVEALKACHHQGSCDADVAEWYDRCEEAFSRIPSEELAEELAKYTDWNINDRRTNIGRLIWIAAGDYQEELHNERN